MAGLAVGIDIGGTKTHLRAGVEGGETWELVLPTAEWRVRNWDEDAASLLGLVRRLAAEGDVAALVVGAHGCDDAAECDAFRTALARRTSFPVEVLNDAELLPAALGYRNQIGLVAGTGSIAVCRSAETGMLVAGGWGWVIGDEGSASGLVREAGRAINLYLDCGGTTDEPLVKLLFDTLGIKTTARIGSAIANQGGASGLGRHAHVVFEAEVLGSRIARQVILDGARHLVDLVDRLKNNGSQADVVVAGGGVIVAQPRLANAFLDEVRGRFGGAVTGKIYSGPPVDGAWRLAVELQANAAVPPRTLSASSSDR